MQAVALRYALAPACVLLAVLLHLSPVGAAVPLAGLFVFAVLAAAWFGGAGPGFVAALLATFTLPQLVTVSYPLLGGVLDLPRFVTFSIEGLLVGWWSYRRRRIEAALRESEKRYELAMAASEEGHFHIDHDTEELFASDRFNEIFGLPPGTRLKTRGGYMTHVRFYGKEDDDTFHSALAATFAKDGPDRYQFEYRILLPSGAMRWIRSRGKVIRDADGRARGRNGMVADVTDAKLAEEALRNSEQRYALAMEAAGDGHTDWDLVTGAFYISPRLLEIVGHPADARFADRADWVRRFPFYPEDRPKWEAAMASHMAGREAHFKMELRIVVRGEVRWTAFHFLSTRDADGRPVRWTGSIGDITGQKRIEEALRASEERISLAMEASEEGYIDCDVQTDRFITSKRMREIFEVPPGTRIAYRSDFNEQFRFYSDEDAKAYADMVRTVSAQGGPDRYEFEFRVVLPSGKVKWIWTRSKVTRDAEGRALRRIGVVADVTARKLAEDALRESERRYELAMAASESGYWDWDVPTNQYFVSPRAYELAGYPPGTTWVSRDEYRANINMHPEDFVRWEAAREALFAGTGERLSMEVRYIVHGETRWHILHAICRRDETGKVMRWTGSSTNITERKLAEEALRRSEGELRQAQRLEAMGTLAGGIAHDFNNILGAILGYGEMAQRDAPKGSRLARDLGSIMIAGERGRALVDRILAFSRSAVGERVPVHVERVVREALDLLSAHMPPSATLHAKLHAGRAAVLGDATQVHQVVTNLATNAVQAMPAGGTLRVELAGERVEAPRPATIGEVAAGEYVVLTVADTGTGIAPEIVDRIFDPFFTTKEIGTGTGLGLSLVHGIVTDLGGAIDVISRAGAGTSFIVYLPCAGTIPFTEEDAELALPRGGGQRVLVVDDEEPLVRLATRTLEELGYAPVGFTSSSAALAAFRADPLAFDALVTDERMPGMSGSALIREVRGLRSSMPVLLMSGYLGATAGKADEVLQKPLSARDLAASLARVLRV